MTSRRTAIAVAALAAGTIGGVALAASSSAQNTQTSIDGCRLLDTREESQVGPRGTPLGPGETITVQATGDNGNCTGIPADAAALDIQLSARNASADTFFTVFDADLTAPPLIAHLNPRASISTTSNTTVVTLSPAGAFKVFNRAGTVDVIIDVLGVFEPGSGTPGPPGPVGPPGPEGPQGEPGASFVVSETTASFVGDRLSVRYKGANSGNEVFLGQGVGESGPTAGAGNRSEAQATWVDGPRPFEFRFDGTTLSTTLAGTGQPPAGGPALTFTPTTVCPAPDLLEIEIRGSDDRAVDSSTSVENLVVNGTPLGSFGPATSSAADYTANQRFFTVEGDFSGFEGGFVITGQLDTVGFGAGANVNERNRVQFTVGCSS